MKIFVSFVKTHYKEITIFLFVFINSLLVFLFSNLRYSNDDQFIIYRYIDNIAKGKGFVYNEGEKILGSTTPLFTLIAALFKYIFNNFQTPDIVAFLNIFFLSLSAIFLFNISRLFIPERFSLFLVLIFSFNLSKIVPEGMESSLFIFTSMGFIFFLFKERYYLSSIFLGLCILTRPDAVLIAILAFIYWLINFGWKRTFFLSAICILVNLPWFIFATYYFGSFIPQSIIAKLHTSDIVNQSSIQAFKVQLAHLSRIYWGKIFDPDNIPIQVVINLSPFLFFVSLGIKKFINKKNWIIFFIPLIYFIVFSVSNPVMFPWYLTQIEPFWILISFFGIYILWRLIKNSFFRTFLIIVIIIGPLYFWISLLWTKNQGTKMPLFEIGNYIKENIKPGEKVGVNNIGIIGYVSNAYIIDFFGLVNEQSPFFYPIKECGDKNIQYQIPPELIMHFRPDWLILSDEKELTSCFRNGKWFNDNYKIERKNPGVIFKKIK